jgi:HSP20 family protein
MALIPFKQLFENEWIESLEDDLLKTPKMDIYETEKEIIAEIEIPGIDPKNIDIEVGDSSLKIETKKESKKEAKNKGYFRKEISTGYYRRIVSLPESIKKEKAVADYENGILKIKIPKIKEGKKLKIKVQEKI